jgi:glycerol-3-phosphate acyltransferase PlsY
VSTSGGVFFAISPWIALVAFGIWLLIVSSTRYVSLGSIITLAISPPLVYAPHLTLWYLINNHIFGPSNFHISILFITCIFILTMVNGLLVTYRHRTNIIRLLHHKENRFGKHHDKKD